MILDAHCSLGRSIYGPGLSAEHLLALMEANAIEKAVVSPFTPPDLDLERVNRELAATVNGNARLIGFARIDPRPCAAAIAQLHRCLAAGLRGIKVDPFEQAFHINSRLTEPFFRECDALGVPVLVVAGHLSLSSPIQVGDLAERIPGLTIIMAHGGQLMMHGLGIFDAVEVLKDSARVYIETSGIPETGSNNLIERAATEVAVDRVLFGTNLPFYDPAVELERINAARIPDAMKQQMRGPNLARLLSL
jgi:predicted TIM-barrel fold metal-dependent hydrolase